MKFARTILCSLMLIVPSVCFAEENDDIPKQDTVISKNSSNVILGRELISVTQALEESARRQHNVISLRESIAEAQAHQPHRLTAFDSKLDSYKKQATNWVSRINEIKKELETLRNQPTQEAEGEGQLLPSRNRMESTIRAYHLEIADIRDDLNTIESRYRELEEYDLRFYLDGQNSVHHRLRTLGIRLDSIEQALTNRESANARSRDSLLMYEPDLIPRSYSSGNTQGISTSFSNEPRSNSFAPPAPLPDEISIDQMIADTLSRISRIETASEAFIESVDESIAIVANCQEKNVAFEKLQDELDAKASAILGRLQTEFEQVRSKKATVEDLLNERDANLNQFEINQLLVYAVYGMVASIILLFVLLKWYPSSLTELIVEQRVFVEVLSMGFLLVTVIILGSAKLITGEGLAGLLGTIAGYIFAKKASELITGRYDNRTAGAIERQLAQAYLEADELESQLKKLQEAGGEDPTEKQQETLEATRAQLENTNARINRLSKSLESMAKLRPAGERKSLEQ